MKDKCRNISGTVNSSYYPPQVKKLGIEANDECSNVEGCKTRAIGECSHAEGICTTAGTETGGEGAHAEGCETMAIGCCSHAEGCETKAIGSCSHSEGCSSKAISKCSHAEGICTTAGTDNEGEGAHAEGCNTQALGDCSHAEGNETIASGSSSHAEGVGTEASEEASHAEGSSTDATGIGSHAEGIRTEASGEGSHAEGGNTTASGFISHAEGDFTTASGDRSHAEGLNTEASGEASHAEGRSTSTNNMTGAHIMGQFGDACAPFSWNMANGTNLDNKSISARILNDGAACFSSVIIDSPCPCTDFAEMFETAEEDGIDVGYFVAFNGESDKIRKATSNDNFILGITSAAPALLAGAAELNWSKKYITDEWGRVQYHEVTAPAVTDKEGNIIVPERTESQPVLNPEWQSTREYIPRLKRPEWVAVGLLGQLPVRDDGTCKAGSFCKPNDEGIATASSTGYRVIKRTSENQVLVIFR